jgi:uncharacterized Zn finger protein
MLSELAMTCPACGSPEVVAELLTVVTASLTIRRLMCSSCGDAWFGREPSTAAPALPHSVVGDSATQP